MAEVQQLRKSLSGHRLTGKRGNRNSTTTHSKESRSCKNSLEVTVETGNKQQKQYLRRNSLISRVAMWYCSMFKS
jgi:hypothetical protein